MPLTLLGPQVVAGALDPHLLPEEVRFTCPARLRLGTTDCGAGTAFVTSQRLAWVDAANARGYAISYPDLTLFAICRDAGAVAEPCIFGQLACSEDDSEEEGAAHAGGSSSDGSSVNLGAVADLQLAPLPEAGEGALGLLFQHLCSCSELHVDEDADGDSEGEGGFYGSDDEEEEGEDEEGEEGDSAPYTVIAGEGGAAPSFHAGHAVIGEAGAPVDDAANAARLARWEQLFAGAVAALPQEEASEAAQ